MLTCHGESGTSSTKSAPVSHGARSLCSKSFQVESRALLGFVAVCNRLLPVCWPLLSRSGRGANRDHHCELSVRPRPQPRREQPRRTQWSVEFLTGRRPILLHGPIVVTVASVRVIKTGTSSWVTRPSPGRARRRRRQLRWPLSHGAAGLGTPGRPGVPVTGSSAAPASLSLSRFKLRHGALGGSGDRVCSS